MKLGVVCIGLLLLTTVAEAQGSSTRPNGTIYGIAYDSDGRPASQIKLTALPEWWGRYTLYADDEEAGYSAFSTGSLGQTQPEEVGIAAAHREGERTVHLPIKAGFLRINLTNSKTAAGIPSMRIVVMRLTNPPALAFSSSCSSRQVILLPPDNKLLHGRPAYRYSPFSFVWVAG